MDQFYSLTKTRTDSKPTAIEARRQPVFTLYTNESGACRPCPTRRLACVGRLVYVVTDCVDVVVYVVIACVDVVVYFATSSMILTSTSPKAETVDVLVSNTP